MDDKLKAIEINLRLLLNRVEEVNYPERVNYEVEKKVNEIQQKIYEAADILEEIETMEEL